ncbi:TetR/AcrR family transcriptional regulator [Amycolatopsis taiwanensis]|uniref:TetR/AcrR family transcriptional regulator n=1 Tax=Amycolatopsis taiwanensis TaxID=342230 RepID=UPI00069363B9|nr:TetR/AcrR family transcriptional regulator [Amycolatopsis taiwanensis]
MTDIAASRVGVRTRAKRSTPEQRRLQIIDAAVSVFGRQGYRQGALKTVADEVGLTIQGLLHYFPTKEELLLAALHHRNALDRENLQRVLEEGGVVAVTRYILQRNVEHPGFMRLFVTLAAEATDPDHPAHEYFVERYTRVFSYAGEAIQADVRKGAIRPDVDADALAEQLVALMDGLQLQALLRPEMDLLAAFDRAVAALVTPAER